MTHSMHRRPLHRKECRTWPRCWADTFQRGSQNKKNRQIQFEEDTSLQDRKYTLWHRSSDCKFLQHMDSVLKTQSMHRRPLHRNECIRRPRYLAGTFQRGSLRNTCWL